METKDHPLNVLMFPWLAHGHIIPFLELAKRLTQRNIFVYFCSTPINLSSIKQQLNEKAFPSIQLVEIQLPHLPNLPPKFHTTKSLPPHLMPTLKKAFDLAKPAFSDILSLLKPNLLIYDFIQPWAPVLASSLNIPSILFLTTGAASSSFFLNKFLNPSSQFPFPAIYLHEYEARKIAQRLNSNIGGNTDMDRFVQCIYGSSGFVAIKMFREIESGYINHLSDLMGKEIIPVGPLVQESPQEDNHESNKFTSWLGNKETSSTVFVSFGSEYFMSNEEIEEIAYGLELSNVNFIWVLRLLEEEKVGIEEVLPSGFLERVGKRGLVAEGWAPQGRILEHSSIGGFLTHCGWSSVLEGMKFGVPLIALPLQLDQPFNARLVVEVGVGVEVKRDPSGDGRFYREEVARGIRVVMMENEGEGVRRKAKEMAEKMNKKGDGEIEVFVEKLVELSYKTHKS
ncbi:UDP-glucosyltransferase 29-like [Tasmannia lanceolata]|uniref:UDP-glucosyltransferase 29-like n=1 Tax=Tasmannia lanceolata TaxID=3420 RepID=UPI004063F78A